LAIEIVLTLRLVFDLALHQAEAFNRSTLGRRGQVFVGRREARLGAAAVHKLPHGRTRPHQMAEGDLTRQEEPGQNGNRAIQTPDRPQASPLRCHSTRFARGTLGNSARSLSAQQGKIATAVAMLNMMIRAAKPVPVRAA